MMMEGEHESHAGSREPPALGIDALPIEVVGQFLEWVESVPDLCACAATCRTWASLAWCSRRRLQLRFPSGAPSPVGVQENSTHEII